MPNEPWCTCGAGEFQPPEMHHPSCVGSTTQQSTDDETDRLALFASDESVGDVISAEPDGTIVLDDGITTWNPRRACEFLLSEQRRQLATTIEALSQHPYPDTAYVRLNDVLAAVHGLGDTPCHKEVR